jgi:hypothetical protein
MNVLLRDTEEFIDGKPTGSLGLVLIRYATTTSVLLDGIDISCVGVIGFLTRPLF